MLFQMLHNIYLLISTGYWYMYIFLCEEQEFLICEVAFIIPLIFVFILLSYFINDL